MIELIIDNSYSIIKGLSIEQHKELHSVLSYYTAPSNSYMAKQYGVKKVSLLSKHGVFPTGLVSKVYKWLPWPGTKVIDRRVPPKSTPGMFKLKV